MPVPPSPPTVPTPVAAWVERLESAWRAWRPGGEPPRWDDFLPPEREPFGPDLVFHLVQLDIEMRARAGLPGLLAERHFHLSRLARADARLDEARQVELIRWEIQQRWKNGERPRRAEYREAFPEHAQALAALGPFGHCTRCRRGGLALAEGDEELLCSACGAAVPISERFPQRPEVPQGRGAIRIDRPTQGAPPSTAGGQWDPPLQPALAVPGYEVLGELGRGGMGVVYQARQVRANRLVALKMLLSGGHARAAETARFRREAEAVARLQHPNIVQVFEVGEHHGQPFFSMEFCTGGSLDRVLAGTPLPAKDAAALVETLARAVQAANERGIVHRDLKPANVLLQVQSAVAEKAVAPPVPENSSLRALRSGLPKVSDFGLAKTLDGAAAQTQSGAVVGTSSYMAPEQASGKAKHVGPLADVYALGAILYECLTGRPPFRAATPYETILQVVWDEPVPPRQLQNRTPLDLETICMKCLRKEPAQRYASALALAEDLGRWLGGMPIQARPVGPLERGWKWVRRRPALAGLIGVSVTAAAMLIAGLAVGLWAVNAEKTKTQSNLERALEAEETATRNLGQAEASLKLARKAVDDCYNVAKEHPAFQRPQTHDARRVLLRATWDFYKQFRSQHPDDRGLQREEADQFFRVGDIAKELGDSREALYAYQQARELLGLLAKCHPDVPEYQNDLARSHNNLGILLYVLGKGEEALKEYQQARELFGLLAKSHPDVPRYQDDLSSTHHNLGLLLRALGKRQEALKEYQQARDVNVRLAKSHPDVPKYRSSLATTHNNLGVLLDDLGKRQDALQEYQRARDVNVRLAKSHPDVPEYQQDLARSHNNLGVLLDGLGKREEALKEYQRTRELFVRLAKSHPDVPKYRSSLATTHNNLGALLNDLGKRQDALQEYQQARDLNVRLAKSHPDVPKYRSSLAATHNNLGALLKDLGKGEEALREYQQARDLFVRLAKSHPDVLEYQQDLARTHHNLGVLLRPLGKHQEALEEFQRAFDLRTRLVKSHPGVPDYLDGLIRTCLSRGDLMLRLSQWRDALATLDEGIRRTDELRQLDPHHPMLASFLLSTLPCRAGTLTRLGRVAEADADWDRALKLAAADQRPSIHMRRADGLARAGLHVHAAAQAEALGGDTTLSAGLLYNLACVHALNAAVVAKTSAQPLPVRENYPERYARSAIALLQRATKAGHFRDPANIAHLHKDENLAFLRPRDDYRAFVRGLPAAAPKP